MVSVQRHLPRLIYAMLVPLLSVELQAFDCDGFLLREIGKMVPANRDAHSVRTIHKGRPLSGEVMSQAEQECEVGRVCRLEEVVECCFHVGGVYALPGGVTNVQDHVCNRRVVEGRI